MKKSIFITTISFLFAIFIAGCSDSGFDPEVTVDKPDQGGNVHFTLLQTTDMHHRASGSGASATYSPTDGVDNSDSTDLTTGGYSRLAGKISEIRNAKKNKNVLLVDSGDFLMGTVYDFSLGGSLPPLAFAFMEAMNYDAITLGNHEFDFGPGPLSSFIDKAMGSGGTSFNVPILASNMVTDPTDIDDDGIEYLVGQGVIKGVVIKILDNGLKVGMIGLMGADAETKAPLATPVTFTNDLTDTSEIAALQTIVTDLKDQVDIVIALSHSGVSNTDPASPAGDDITLAQQVTGIDIIASGHDHATTDSVLEIVNGDHTTYIICAGHYGKSLAQLDVAYKVETGKISDVSLKNNAINDSTEGDDITQTIVEMYETGINEALAPLSVNQIVGTTNSDNVGKSSYAAESGIGNLVADSLRYVGLSLLPYEPDPTIHTLSVVANGVVRNGFTQGQQISFADMYSVLPLGMTLEDPITEENSAPGYPLVKVYLTGEEIKNMAQLISYVIAAGDTDFVSSLGALDANEAQMRAQLLQLAGGLNSGDPIDIITYTSYVAPASDPVSTAAQAAYSTAKTNGASDSVACQAAAQIYAFYGLTADDGSKVLQLVLPSLGSDYFLHVSGVQYTHKGSAGSYQIDPTLVKMYNNTDIQCVNAPSAVDDGKYYPVIVDIYVVLMMQDPVFVTLLSGLGIPVIPTNIDGSVNVTAANIMDYAVTTDGTTEVKEWQAFLTYLTSAEADLGLGGLIPDSAYGTDAINTGYSSRVNQP